MGGVQRSDEIGQHTHSRVVASSEQAGASVEQSGKVVTCQSVQATSVSSEQDFSTAGQVDSRLRASLNPKSTHVLTLLHANDNLLTAILERKKKANL